jgi:hypothetical protein
MIKHLTGNHSVHNCGPAVLPVALEHLQIFLIGKYLFLLPPPPVTQFNEHPNMELQCCSFGKILFRTQPDGQMLKNMLRISQRSHNITKQICNCQTIPRQMMGNDDKLHSLRLTQQKEANQLSVNEIKSDPFLFIYHLFPILRLIAFSQLNSGDSLWEHIIIPFSILLQNYPAAENLVAVQGFTNGSLHLLNSRITAYLCCNDNVDCRCIIMNPLR